MFCADSVRLCQEAVQDRGPPRRHVQVWYVWRGRCVLLYAKDDMKTCMDDELPKYYSTIYLISAINS